MQIQLTKQNGEKPSRLKKQAVRFKIYKYQEQEITQSIELPGVSVMIQLDQQVLEQGQSIKGWVKLQLQRQIQNKEVQVKLLGICTLQERLIKSREEVYESTFTEMNFNEQFSQTHIFLEGKQTLLYNGQSKLIPLGVHYFEFEFQVDQSIPPSYIIQTKEKRVKISYFIRAQPSMLPESQHVSHEVRVVCNQLTNQEEYSCNFLQVRLSRLCVIGIGDYCVQIVLKENNFFAGDQVRGRVMLNQVFEKSRLQNIKRVRVCLVQTRRVNSQFMREFTGCERQDSRLVNQIDLEVEMCKIEYGMLVSHFVISLKQDLQSSIRCKWLSIEYHFEVQVEPFPQSCLCLRDIRNQSKPITIKTK